MVMGGGGGGVTTWVGVWREKRVKNRVFHTEGHIYNLQILLNELISLSESPLLVLSMTFHA